VYDRGLVRTAGFEAPWKDFLSRVERREIGISDGRLGVAVVPALETGRGIDDDLACFRSESRGVEGRDSISPSLSTTTQLSPVRSRFVMRGRSSSWSTDSIDNTP